MSAIPFAAGVAAARAGRRLTPGELTRLAGAKSLLDERAVFGEMGVPVGDNPLEIRREIAAAFAAEFAEFEKSAAGEPALRALSVRFDAANLALTLRAKILDRAPAEIAELFLPSAAATPARAARAVRGDAAAFPGEIGEIFQKAVAAHKSSDLAAADEILENWARETVRAAGRSGPAWLRNFTEIWLDGENLKLFFRAPREDFLRNFVPGSLDRRAFLGEIPVAPGLADELRAAADGDPWPLEKAVAARLRAAAERAAPDPVARVFGYLWLREADLLDADRVAGIVNEKIRREILG